jgi:uncharacterized repeat protein (TIGR01451 family)
MRRGRDWIFSTTARILGASFVGAVTVGGTVVAMLAAVGAFGATPSTPPVTNNFSDSTVNQYYGSLATPPASGPSEPPPTSNCASQGMGTFGYGQVYVGLTAKLSSNDCWSEYLAPVIPGSTVKFLITYRNLTRVVEKNVQVFVILPKGFQLVPNQTYIYNGSWPKGFQDTSNDLDEGGLIIGTYASRAVAYVTFYATVPFGIKMSCGWNDFRPMAFVRPEEMSEYYDTADLRVARQC